MRFSKLSSSDITQVGKLLKDPTNTYEMIGQKFGITRERVRQVGEEHFPEVMSKRRQERALAADFREKALEEKRQAKWVEHICEVCESSYLTTNSRSRFCSNDCSQLWLIFFHYHLNWQQAQLYQSSWVVRNPEKNTIYQIANAKRILAEYKKTGKVERRRILGRLPENRKKSENLAKKIGIDLHATLERMLKAGIK